MKFYRKKKIITAFLALTLSVTTLASCKKEVPASKEDLPETGVVCYGFSEPVKYDDYLPVAEANRILKESEAVAFRVNSQTGYYGGEYKDYSGEAGAEEYVFSMNKDRKITVNTDLFAKLTGLSQVSGSTPEEMAASVGKTLITHENKLFIFAKAGTDINEFDNFYSFEIIDLILRNAPEEDITNALITLPSEVTNNSNLTLKYSDSDLDLGLATTLYALQGYNATNTTLKTCPKIVAGEGRDANSHTVVRVYNEYQAKTMQFLAYPASVTGGVRVKCAYVANNGVYRGVIVTAAYEAKEQSAKYVRIYDEYGIPYMVIEPKTVKAPFNIVTGHFNGSKTETLLVTGTTVGEGGACPYEIFELKGENGAVQTGEIKADASFAGEQFELSLINNGNDDSLLVYFTGKNEAYTCALDGSFSQIQSLDGRTNSIAQSAFGGYTATLSADDSTKDMAYMQLIGSEADGNVNISEFENIFYWYATQDNVSAAKAKFSDTDYVKKAEFQHQRTDYAAKAFATATSVKKVPDLAEKSYSKWEASISYKSYAKSYNVWEPCFTHRLGKTQAATSLYNYKDADGWQIYMAYTKDDKTDDYVELDSSFYNATYADGLIIMDKLRIYPLRSALRKLYAQFVTDPQKLAGLEPIHEIEIAVGDSVGDYNPYMIETFRSYLLERYETLDNINKKFGTDFKSRSEIDAPRDHGRGEWDNYKGKYFDEWNIFTRKIVNKRLTESFREALLAGFPAEIISSHSIPEGDAVSGFLGQANTRMSPIDAIMTLGCGFGSTRYGTWYKVEDNFLSFAYRAGFRNITLGEYNSLNDSKTASDNQLHYIWNNGAKFIFILNIHDNGTKNDIKSVQNLAEENKPRPGTADGSTASLAVSTETSLYQIAEIGGTDTTTGLLKSVNKEGKWTGDIYLVPFHSYIDVTGYDLGTSAKGGETPEITGLQTGDCLEFNLIASYEGEGEAKVFFEFYEDGVLNNSLSTSYTIGKGKKVYRYWLSNQVPLGSVKIKVRYEAADSSALKISSLTGSAERESIARKFYDDREASMHTGGVTFDILTREHLYSK